MTGDFDDWNKTIKLEKEDGVFQKTVELPKAKHQYKVSTYSFSPKKLQAPKRVIPNSAILTRGIVVRR